MQRETGSRGLILFVLILGAATTLVALRSRPATNPAHKWLASDTEDVARDPRRDMAAAFKDQKSPILDANPLRNANGDARDRPKAPKLSTRKTAAEILENDSPVHFVDTPLRDALTALKEQHGLTFWLDESALGSQKSRLNQHVSLAAEGVSLNWVLDKLLLPLDLDWIAERNLVRVTSAAEAAKHMEVRAYDVLDLIDAGFDQETLIELVESCVHPESWSATPDAETGLPKQVPLKTDPVPKKEGQAEHANPAAPTGRGRSRVSNGILVVWQTQRVHAELVHLLDELEVILDDAEEDRRFDPHIVTVHHRWPIKSSQRRLRVR